MIRRARRLAVFLLALVSIGFCLLEVRLLHLQLLRYCPPERNAVYRSFEASEAGLRGKIVDASGGVLARSIAAVDVCVWAPDVKRRLAFARHLSFILGIEPEEIVEKLRRSRWSVLARGVRDPAAIQELRGLSRRAGFRALHIEPGSQRLYPRGDLFSPLLGFVDHEGRGVAGLERLVDADLAPRPGTRKFRRDARYREMLEFGRAERPARPGDSVVVTLDPVVQEIAGRALDQLILDVKPRWAQALVVEPATGRVLAMAQRPAPPAGGPGRPEDLKRHRLLATQVLYRPGSSLKPLMLAFALQRGLVGFGEQIDCGHGAYRFGGRSLHDVDGGHGVLTVPEILVRSSNIGMARILTRLVPPEVRRGDPRFQEVLDFLVSVGFGGRVTRLPGEERGILTPLEAFSRNNTLVSLSFGHEIAVTAAQMAAAACALVNGGQWRPLRVLEGRLAVSGPVPIRGAEPRRALDPAVADALRGVLQRVVEEGGTRKFRPRGYSMGAKTGTADKEEDRSRKTTSIFAFGPVLHPAALVLVVADEPTKGRFSSQIVGPAAGRILGEVLSYLQVPCDRPEEIRGGSPSHTALSGGPGGASAMGYATAARAQRTVTLRELAGAAEAHCPDGAARIPIRNLSTDSRSAGPGALFFAVAGCAQRGADFAGAAVERGAVAIVADAGLDAAALPGPVPILRVPDVRRAKALVAQQFYGHPSESLTCVGITGTNGKTTTSLMVHSILEVEGMRPSLVGTIEQRLTGGQVRPSHNTTPDAIEIAELLAATLERGGRAAVLEVSSHALDQQRTKGLQFQSAVFTQLSREHLDYHGTFEQYREAKAVLFRDLAPSAVAVLNAEDPVSDRFREVTRARCLTYGCSEGADVRARVHRLDIDGMAFDLIGAGRPLAVSSRLIGRHNLMNALAASAAALSLGIPPQSIRDGIEAVHRVPGRLEPIDRGQDFRVLVDYAHTDDALDKVLRHLRPLTRGRILTVFGCGGDRDRSKRPRMGRVAALGSDVAIVTNDNPRSEEPEQIAREVLGGIPPQSVVEVVLDRREAIRRALEMARGGDIVLIAGKGHETEQVVGSRRLRFDDREVAEDILWQLSP